jgi:hypothetical protein
MGKPKHARRNDIPKGTGIDVVKANEFEMMLAKDGPDALKERVAKAARADLDRWVTELAGQSPHASHDNEFVAASLIRWIDGDKNWGDDPKRMEKTNGNGGAPPPEPTEGTTEETTHEQAETPEGAEAMTTKKKTTHKAVPPKKEKVAKPPKAKKEPKVMRKPDGTIVKRPWGERTAWFVKAFKANKEAKLTGEQIMVKAAKEFGKDNVGKGAWTLERLIEAMTTYAKKEQYGMEKSDLPFNVK